VETSGDSLAFLRLIYEPAMVRSPGYLLIWTAAGKRSAWFRSVKDAAEYAHRCKGDTYVGVGLSKRDYGPTQRAKAAQIVCVPALWLDIDYQSPGVHKHEDLPPDVEGARLLIEDVGIRPSAIVHTGHGLQAWWRLSDCVINSAEDQRALADLVRRWQQHQIRQARRNRGWRIDATHDLARLMRLPGTWNMKGDPVPVTLE